MRKLTALLGMMHTRNANCAYTTVFVGVGR